jgi:hypothetical protein
LVRLRRQALEMMQSEKEAQGAECERMTTRLEAVLGEMERMEEQLEMARSLATDSAAGSAPNSSPSTPRGEGLALTINKVLI